MSVKLSVSYGINNIRDLNKISDIVITIPGEGSYTLNPVLVGTREIDVTIPASYMTGYNNRDKVYSATIVYNMKDGSSYRSFSSAVVRIYTTQLITPPPTPTPTPTITPTPTPTASPTSTPSPTPTPKPVVINNAPDVKLDVPSWVRAGDTFYARAYASDPDGDNLEYDWRIGNAQGTINGYWGSLWYDKAYVNTNQEIYVFVSDSYTFGYDYAVINVTEPTVKALMKMDGTFNIMPPLVKTIF